MTRSCSDCPSMLPPAAQGRPGVYGKSLGVNVCGRYGKVLGRPGDPDAQTAFMQRTAEGCSAYMVPADGITWKRDFTVALPDPTVLASTPDPTSQSAVTNCTMCKNYTKPATVVTELGWPTGMCRAKGELILQNHTVEAAMGCEYRDFGSPRDEINNLIFLEEYKEGFFTKSEEKKLATKALDQQDPREYPTDAEVGEKQQAAGVRAYRRVVNPDNEDQAVLMPIFRDDFFEPEDLALIPRAGDDGNPELYVDHFGGLYTLIVAWLYLDETPAVVGPAGTGKTELFRYAAWLMNVPFRRISITASSELDDLAGKMKYSPEKGTYYEYGRLPRAWQSPGVLCLDEPNTGPPEVWQFIRPLTDNAKQLALDMNEGEIIKRSDGCYLGMAMNPDWDIINSGAQPLADADANRLLHMWVGLPTEAVERSIIKRRVQLDGWEMTEQQIDMVIKIAKELRDLIANHTLQASWAIRPQIKVARALRWFDPVTAYRRALGDSLPPETRDTILTVVRSHAPRPVPSAPGAPRSTGSSSPF